MSQLTRQHLMCRLHALKSCLVAEHQIRNVADYAEQIVAEALEGQRRSNSVAKGYDVLAPVYGRVEVKFRQLPNDGRIEERVALSNAKKGEFDNLAIVVFHADFSIKGVVLVPFHEAWPYIESSPYNRISYMQASSCLGALDITDKVIASAQR